MIAVEWKRPGRGARR